MRIMTSNIWGDYFKNPVDVREDFLYDVFKKYDADIIGLQEVTPNWYKGEMMTKWLPDEYMFVGTELTDNKNYVPFVYKKYLKLVSKGYEYLENTPDASKGITWAVLKREDDSLFAVCNTHFWWMTGPEHDVIRVDNAHQLVNLMKALKNRYNCPVFAFGDMNCVLASDVFKVYAENDVQHMLDLAEKKCLVGSHHGDPVLGEDGRYHGTKTEKDKNLSIDHMVALGDGFKVLEYMIVEDQKALDATDHSPVYVDIEF
ncbi:MAG: endonuclease/exonuclease/phosphatase family protein [Oscillospiraceae bacterium]|nr:endonuclease/exonuclease/phosphatase family protein [Oscillospiraceae bacterium]